MTNSLQAASPLERLKRLDSRAEERVEISETPVQVTDKADRSPEVKRESNVVRFHTPALNTHDPHLVSAGWRPKERCGKTIWLDPREGFWLSQEMALVMLERRK